MMEIDISTPDLGGNNAYPVVKVITNIGDKLSLYDTFLVLGSDKDSIEIPVTNRGKVVELKVGLGDKVSTCDLVAIIRVDNLSKKDIKTQQSESQAQLDTIQVMPTNNESYLGAMHVTCEVIVLGSGPTGYSAVFVSADLGVKTVIVEREETLGGVCLNFSCIFSKALLYVAETIDETKSVSSHGVKFSLPEIDFEVLRNHIDGVVSKLTNGITGMAKGRKVDVVSGKDLFLDAHHIEVTASSSEREVVKFEMAIVAAGSFVVILPFMPDDSRVVDSTGALELRDILVHMLVIGGCLIGMEMATVYSSLGSKFSVDELWRRLMPGADADLDKSWMKENKHCFQDVLLETKVVTAKATDKGIEVAFEGKSDENIIYDKVLVAVGRRLNRGLVSTNKSGVNVDKRGFVSVDKQMRTNVNHIFATGDLVVQPMFVHKAVHEEYVAAESANDKRLYFDARVIPSVAYPTPEIALTVVTETQAKAKVLAYEIAVFPWSASGNAISNNASTGFTKLIFEPKFHPVIGGAHASDLISEVCLANELGADATDIGRAIHPHYQSKLA